MPTFPFEVEYALPTEREDGSPVTAAELSSIKIKNGTAVLAEHTDFTDSVIEFSADFAEGINGVLGITITDTNGKESVAGSVNFATPVIAPPNPPTVISVNVG